VSQGHAFWRDAVGRRGELEPVVRDYWSGRGSWAKDADDPAYRGRQSPQGIAAAVLDLRIGRDPLDAADDT
jgi:hypothetical protein